VVRLTDEVFEAAAHFEMRLRESCCGLRRFAGEPPIASALACLPQVRAGGTACMLLQACLGLHRWPEGPGARR
jgi:hypothetical protein